MGGVGLALEALLGVPLHHPLLLAQHKPLAPCVGQGSRVVQGHSHLPLVVLFEKCGVSLDVAIVGDPSSPRVVLWQVRLVDVRVLTESPQCEEGMLRELAAAELTSRASRLLARPTDVPV